MREIIFKAKRIDNGEWIEGYLFDNGFDGEEKKYFVGGLVIEKYNGTACDEWDITGIDFCEIDPETVCQFTGLTDKNGKKIWENDIVFVTDKNGCSGQISTGFGDVIFIEGMWYINGRVQEVLYDINKVFQIEVIGNIFDNSELLQEE